MSDAKKIILIGDRVLIDPNPAERQTSAGLYLPPNVTEKEKVQTGYVVQTGPGYQIPHSSIEEKPPWEQENHEVSSPQYLPLQAEEGDYAVFLKKAAIDVRVDDKDLLIVPHSALLLLQRDTLIEED
ncbi:MAG: co-chaperone GroES family protein [Candidatus Marinimicrobia bacterium]|nr:co-chaperone GroES family protein [Candidatus Neomarinimicrobiota bacterium]